MNGELSAPHFFYSISGVSSQSEPLSCLPLGVRWCPRKSLWQRQSIETGETPAWKLRGFSFSSLWELDLLSLYMLSLSFLPFLPHTRASPFPARTGSPSMLQARARLCIYFDISVFRCLEHSPWAHMIMNNEKATIGGLLDHS